MAPSQISFLAELPLKTRAAVINAIRNQIPLSQDHTGTTGFNGWVTGDHSETLGRSSKACRQFASPAHKR